MVTQHCHRGRKNLSMAWIVVNGDHGLRMWLQECLSFMNSCYQLSCTIARRPGQYRWMMYVQCRLCNKVPGNVAHVLSGCPALAQNQYLASGLENLFFWDLTRSWSFGTSTALVFASGTKANIWKQRCTSILWNTSICGANRGKVRQSGCADHKS